MTMIGCSNTSLGINPDEGLKVPPDVEGEASAQGLDAGVSDLGGDLGKRADAGYPTYTLVSGNPPDIYIGEENIPVLPWTWEPTATFSVSKVCAESSFLISYPLPGGKEETSTRHSPISTFDIFPNGNRPAALCSTDGTWVILDTNRGEMLAFNEELQNRIERELDIEIKRPHSPLSRFLGRGLNTNTITSNVPSTWTVFPIELDENRFWIPFQDFPPFEDTPNRFGLIEVNLETEEFRVFWEDALPLEPSATSRSIDFWSVQEDKLILGAKVREEVAYPDGTTRFRSRLARLEIFDLENESHLATVPLPTEPLHYGENTMEGYPFGNFENSLDIEFGDALVRGDNLWISHFSILRAGSGPIVFVSEQPGPSTLSHYNLRTGEWSADVQLPVRGTKEIAFLEGENAVVLFGLSDLRLGEVLPEEFEGLVASPTVVLFNPEEEGVARTQTLPVPESSFAADMLYDSKLTSDGRRLFVDAGGVYYIPQENAYAAQLFGMSYQESGGVYLNAGEEAQPFVSIGPFPYTFLENPDFGTWSVLPTSFVKDFNDGYLLARGFNRDLIYVDFLGGAAYYSSLPGEMACHAFPRHNHLTLNEDGSVVEEPEDPVYEGSCARRQVVARVLGNQLLVSFDNDIFVTERP